jgi:hypothetical protein
MKEDLPYPKQRLHLPVILSRPEVAQLIAEQMAVISASVRTAIVRMSVEEYRQPLALIRILAGELRLEQTHVYRKSTSAIGIRTPGGWN